MQVIKLNDDTARILNAKTDSQRELIANVCFGKSFNEFLHDLEVEVKSKMLFSDNIIVESFTYRMSCSDDRILVVNAMFKYDYIDDMLLLNALKLIPGVAMHSIAHTESSNNGFYMFDFPRKMTIEVNLSLMPKSFENEFVESFSCMRNCGRNKWW